MEQDYNCKRVVMTAEVESNERVRERYYRLTLTLDALGSKAFANVRPGQFVEVQLSNVSLPRAEDIPPGLSDAAQRQILLRRPFSFSHVDTSGATAKLTILYCVLGPATVRMTTLIGGDKLSVIGPLGNGFRAPGDIKNVILVAGGMGAPPILHMAGFLQSNYPKMNITAFFGAKTVEDLPVQLGADNSICELSGENIQTVITTDDGSVGFKGFVTECLIGYIEKKGPDPNGTMIYSCGPEPMLAAVAKLAGRYNIPCQVSMERAMACGIGVCQSCAVETRADEGKEIVFKLCCKDGPVFDGSEVVFKG